MCTTTRETRTTIDHPRKERRVSRVSLAAIDGLLDEANGKMEILRRWLFRHSLHKDRQRSDNTNTASCRKTYGAHQHAECKSPMSPAVAVEQFTVASEQRVRGTFTALASVLTAACSIYTRRHDEMKDKLEDIYNRVGGPSEETLKRVHPSPLAPERRRGWASAPMWMRLEKLAEALRDTEKSVLMQIAHVWLLAWLVALLSCLV
jgi:hypothetical protein